MIGGHCIYVEIFVLPCNDRRVTPPNHLQLLAGHMCCCCTAHMCNAALQIVLCSASCTFVDAWVTKAAALLPVTLESKTGAGDSINSHPYVIMGLFTSEW